MSSWMMFEAVRIFFIVALIYLAYIDWRTFRLPDVITIPLIALGLLLTIFKFCFYQLFKCCSG